MNETIIKCEQCHAPVSGDLHTCPYKEEVNNDTEALCNCCSLCEHECDHDI